jgi:hypothetical protein
MKKMKIFTSTLKPVCVETEGSPGIDLPPTLGECCTILYADLKEEKLHALQKMVILKCYMKQMVPKNTMGALELCVNVVLLGMLRSARQMRMMRALLRLAHCLQSNDVALAYESVVNG